ncbi:uncharacterized protein LOC113789702 [Dermatophagoides pteronyssinus]|uniref:Uncharacterized protein n=2 Tax=Dermatophagoides pteronyssinus TaxID=6956 RepID=A0ABQ8J612_DERPT|nr:uncharacterized protein LOC113789702 [Dermatophagoides pteronyssinus]KAH9417988.1 hypothetical protein DERP_008242 [Dermatophagoides pteronyssinus]
MKLYFYLAIIASAIQLVFGQAYIGGAYDFGQNRYGERRGELGPAAIAGITIGAVSVLMALMVTIYFCYYTANHVSDDYPPPHQVHVPQNYPHTAYQKAPNHPK